MGENKIELDTQLAHIKVIHTQESGALLFDEQTNMVVLHRHLPQPFVGVNSDVVALFKILDQRNCAMKVSAANLQHLRTRPASLSLYKFELKLSAYIVSVNIVFCVVQSLRQELPERSLDCQGH
jgi:hypothetical protein